MRYPVNKPFRVSLKYGATSSPYSVSNPHNGTDLVSDDKQVVAPEDGEIIYAQNTGGKSGYMIVLRGSYRHSFSHIRADGIRVSVGQKVRKGQLLGIMGQTGFATGVHTHWVVNSGSLNPETLITEGEIVSPTRAEVISQFKYFTGSAPSEEQIKVYTSKDWGALNGDLLQFVYDRLKEEKAKGINRDSVIKYINGNLK